MLLWSRCKLHDTGSYYDITGGYSLILEHAVIKSCIFHDTEHAEIEQVYTS